MDSLRVVTDQAAFRATARDAPVGARIPVEVRVPVDDPWTAYRRVRREDAHWGVFLETTGDGGATPDAGTDADADAGTDADADAGTDADADGWNYFAVDPVETFTARPEAVALTDADPDRAGTTAPSFEALAGVLDGTTLARGDCDVPYPCGAFGWLSYDLARELESLPADTRNERALPHVQVGIYDRVAAWRTSDVGDDGPTSLRITACPELPGTTVGDEDGGDRADTDAAHRAVDDADAVDRCYERALDRAAALAARAIDGDPGHGPPPVDDGETATFESDAGRSEYADRVRRVKAYIRDGDTFQANVSHRLRAPAAVHPVAAYDALRSVNPAPYSGLVECPGVDLVSASPELLLERDGRLVRTEPIAGTRARGTTVAEDEALERELLTDEKERAEHAMLVDLERNDLGKVCAYGSVDVAEYRRVDRYSEVMHLVSDVTGQLRDGVDLADAIGAVFPGGTITGAPKPRTMAIIDELESTRRGPYTGAMAALGFDNRATLNIVIRTLTRYQDEYHLRVGAGIVHDSDPEREYDETLDKARALLTAVDDALESDASMDVEAPDA